MTTDLCVEFLDLALESSYHHRYPSSAICALKQLFLVLVECAAQSQETVSRVGISCMKHIIFASGHNFHEEEWSIVTSAIHRAVTVSSGPIKQLLLAFKRKSDSFYGDNATVKVVARNDTTFDEILRLKSLSDQVFLLDQQRENAQNASKKEISIIEDRSYAFLLFSNSVSTENLDSYSVRIAYKTCIVGLLANQMLLQLIANILLDDLKHAPVELHSVIYDHYSSKDLKQRFEVDPKSREILLRCLRQYLTISTEFDARPGLKFLLQKIANLDHAPNLYKQLTSSFIIYYMTLVDAYLSDVKLYNLSNEDITFVMETCMNKNSNTIKKKEYFIKYLFLLRDIWEDVSKLYINLAQETTNSNKNNPGNGIIHVSLKGSTSSLPTSSDGDTNSTESMNESPAKENTTTKTMQQQQQQTSSPIPPEIEQQRQTSMSKDSTYKRNVLAQLLKATMELLRFLPEQSAENLKLLLTPSIQDAFRAIEQQYM